MNKNTYNNLKKEAVPSPLGGRWSKTGGGLIVLLLILFTITAFAQPQQRWARIKPIDPLVRISPSNEDLLLIEDATDGIKKSIRLDSLKSFIGSQSLNNTELVQQFFRSGKFTATPGDNVVTFDNPFPDAEYSVFANATYTLPRQQSLIVRNRSASGFTIKNVITAAEIDWIAMRSVDSLALMVETLQQQIQEITGADGLTYSNDTLYLTAADSVLSFVVISGGSGTSTAFRYDKVLALNENTIDVGTDITQATLVFVNGYATGNFTYSGTQLTLGGEILASDFLTVAQTGDTPLYSDNLIIAETVVSLPFTTTSNSLVFFNGTILQPPQYTGSITLGLDVNENDNLIVKQ
nr:hypothetical protein [uncultured Draconibacterium sp.]